MTRFRLIAAFALLVAGCGGTSHNSSRTVASPAPSTVATSVPASTASPVITAAASSTVPGAPAGARAATTVPAQNAATPTPTVKGTPNKPGSGPSPAVAGTYRYRQSGSATFGSSTKPVPPEGTLKIDPVGGDGNQVWHRTVDPTGPPSDTIFAFRNGGVFVVQIINRSNAGGQQTTFTCTFNPALPSPPWPPTAGATFAGHADCGQFTVDVAGTVSGPRNAPLDGTSHRVFVLTSKLAFHGQLEGTGTQVDWLDPATSLLLHEDNTTNAKYGGVVAISAQTTSDLVSARPQ